MSTTLRDALALVFEHYGDDPRIAPLRALAQSDAQPVAVGWFESPHGAFRANPDYRLEFPSQLLKWSVPVYLAASPQEAQPERQDAYGGVADLRGAKWLTPEQIADIVEAAWNEAEAETVARDEAPETEWTRYGEKVARATERIVRGEGSV